MTATNTGIKVYEVIAENQRVKRYKVHATCSKIQRPLWYLCIGKKETAGKVRFFFRVTILYLPYFDTTIFFTY